MTTPVKVSLFVAALTLSVSVGWVTVIQDPSGAEPYGEGQPIQIRDDGYESSETCKACHPSQYDTWHGSYHRSMTQLVTPETVRGDFGGAEVLDADGRPVRLQRRGDEFWAEFADPDWNGTGEPARLSRRLVMITGSHHQQVYWYRTGQTRVLGQLPVMFLIAEQRWIPRVAAFLGPPGRLPSETGRWSRVCINCHTTHGKGLNTPYGWLPTEAQAADTTVAEFGIACEACHAPGEEHLAVNRSPFRRYRLHLMGLVDPTIVQPEQLDPRRSSEVCGQCHAVWDFYEPSAHEAADRAGLPYRPGGELRNTRFVAQPSQNASATMQRILLENPRFAEAPQFREDSFWSDGMIRVSGREYNGLIDSPCFREARDERPVMSCSSCHTLHKTTDDPRSVEDWADTHQLSADADTNEACLQCHEALRTEVSAHTNHQPMSTGSSCYNCHMPYTTYGLLRAMRSHQVSSPSVSVNVETGRPNACNLCHLDETLAWTSEYLETWYGMPSTALDQDEQTVAASLLWLLRGDAGQRALAAWSMGWQPAKDISGTAWMPPYLAILLNDPYDAVRFIASRSLRSQAGFGQFEYDFVGPLDQRIEARARAVDVWGNRSRVPRPATEFLLDTEGWPIPEEVTRLYSQRDDRFVNLQE